VNPADSAKVSKAEIRKQKQAKLLAAAAADVKPTSGSASTSDSVSTTSTSAGISAGSAGFTAGSSTGFAAVCGASFPAHPAINRTIIKTINNVTNFFILTPRKFDNS